MRVRLSSEARQDLVAIGDYITRDDPSRARSFVKELTDSCAGLGDMALGYPIVPRYETQGIAGVCTATIRYSIASMAIRSLWCACCTARVTMRRCYSARGRTARGSIGRCPGPSCSTAAPRRRA